MPTIIQMDLITEKTWQEVTDKVKELEHIIRKCNPLAAALPTLAKGTTVPSLYSHIAHSDDKEEMDIPQPFKGAHHKQPKSRDGGKGIQPQQKLKNYQHRYKKINTIMRILTITITRIIKVNPEDIDPIEAKIQVDSLEATICVAAVNEIQAYTRANIKTITIRATITRAIKDFIITNIEIFLRVITTAILEVEAVAEVEAIIMAVVIVGPIIQVMLTINTINTMVTMMSTRQINMVHHVHYAVATITLLNIASRESMISMILSKR